MQANIRYVCVGGNLDKHYASVVTYFFRDVSKAYICYVNYFCICHEKNYLSQSIKKNNLLEYDCRPIMDIIFTLNVQYMNSA